MMGTIFPHRFSSKIDLMKGRKRLWKVRSGYNKSGTHTTMGGTMIPNNAWYRSITIFNCSIWIDAGMRHYVVGKTEETSQMERPPFLWWDQHTHTQHSRKHKDEESWRYRDELWVARVLGRESEERGKGLKARSRCRKRRDQRRQRSLS